MKSGVVIDGAIEEVGAGAGRERGRGAVGTTPCASTPITPGARSSPGGSAFRGWSSSRRGLVSYSANLGLRNVSVLELLEAELPKPRVLENDLVAAAVGEAGGGTLALVGTRASGIAGHHVIDGAVPRAARAGEIGHLQFRAGGRRCTCGNRGVRRGLRRVGSDCERHEEAGRPVGSPRLVLGEAETGTLGPQLLDEALAAIGFAAAALVVSVRDRGTVRVGGGVAAAWGHCSSRSAPRSRHGSCRARSRRRGWKRPASAAAPACWACLRARPLEVTRSTPAGSVGVRRRALLEPRVRILPVVEPAASFVRRSGWNVSQHHRQLFRLLGADRNPSPWPGCGPCGIPCGCSVNEPTSSPRRETAAHVVKRLVRVQVRCHVRDLDREGVRFQQARANVQTTKFRPSKVWWDGGGMWMCPVIGSKSSMLNVHGYTKPSQPTTSNGWKSRT